jgi:hypothetical protein
MPKQIRTVCLEFFGQAKDAVPSIVEIKAYLDRQPFGAILAGLEHLDERYLRAVGYATKSRRGGLPKMVLIGDIVGDDEESVARATSEVVRLANARSGEGFAAMARAYARLAEVLPTAPRGLALPPWARLLFGAHEVLVELPALAGAREATNDELAGGGSSGSGGGGDDGGVLARVADAIVWLARQRLVYVDLRPPNVLVADGDGGAVREDRDGGVAGVARVVAHDERRSHDGPDGHLRALLVLGDAAVAD